MKITQEVDYALRVVLYLSKIGYGEKVDAKTISDLENIPHRFLLKLLRKLNAANIVRSFRGVHGGYALNKLPEEITIYDVVLAIDGPIYVNRCLSDPASCNISRTGVCEIHRALSMVQNNIIHDLKSISFKDLLNKSSKISMGT
ncbi:RrF2 family transcriptional regulator [Desnuesiella massiliensis]|uniref:RrF2 family transcriptional regulator n=1 Tax=Desnuesiella massiliensis TaxID=1650662 RepID=UPI0006E2FC4E|nr:Rrf2 family transcriptional regulator [Desnuesiella massiliensis]